MVVDDSVVARRLMSSWIEAEPDLQVVATLRSGREAVDQLAHFQPDVVVLDIEMPELSGVEALPLLLAKRPDLTVIMTSTLLRSDAEKTLEALALGAVDYVAKPASHDRQIGGRAFRLELIERVRHITGARLRLSEDRERITAPAPSPSGSVTEVEAQAPLATPITLRAPSRIKPRALVIAASTGGPQALTTVLKELAPSLNSWPILIVQHMPIGFTAILAEQLTRSCGRLVEEATHSIAAAPGSILVAPGGQHMRVERDGATRIVLLDDGPAVNFCKPSVDPLFGSAAIAWGSATLGLVLTGMGSDGTHGARAIVESGGSVVAQDEPTSVVWGMPGSVAHAGLCCAVLPLQRIASHTIQMFSGERT
jgi:two-component system chemotaxis response regulator CheB